MFSTQFQELLSYPQNQWSEAASNRWISLCTDLRDYRAPCRSFAINKERKWELVSAFQKSIRRGDKRVALRLISAMDSMPEEYAYFWRRLCVIACEDVGPADDLLAFFVVASSTVFPPKKTGNKNYDLLCFLTEQMCDLTARSRIYCSYGVIEPVAFRSELPELLVEDRPIVAAIMRQKAAVRASENSWREWQSKNDWRAEGLLRFVGLRLPLKMIRMRTPLPRHKMLFDLPSYCFDKHTRVGLAMLKRLVRGVEGADGIKALFQQNKIKSAHLALGDALFFEEGGRIEGELIYEPLCSLEQRVFANQSGLSLASWSELRVLVAKALHDGVIDRVSEEMLHEFYDPDYCNQLHEQWRLDF